MVPDLCRKHGIRFEQSAKTKGELLIYFGIRNDIGPPLHMPSERISNRRKLLPSSRMVSASGLISALSPTSGGLHGWGAISFNFRSAKIFGVAAAFGECAPFHNAILHRTSSELSSSGPIRSKNPSGTESKSRMPRPPPTSNLVTSSFPVPANN